MASASSDDLSPFLSNFRISNAEGVMRMVLTLDSLEESRALSLLCRLCALLRESPHNRHALASRGLVGAVLPMLARFSEAVRIELLQLLRLAGMQRLTVHDSRATLQQLQALEAAGAALLRAEADGSPTQRAVAASTAPQSSHAAATRCLELLRLLRDVVASSLPEGTPAAFWDMGPGALGATGLDLPARAAADQSLLGIFSDPSCRLRLAREWPCAAFGMRHPAADQPLVISAAPFSPEVLLRPGSWHFVLLSLRRGSLLSRDEALLSIDGQPAAAAAAFRYPNFTPTANTLGATAAVGAAAGGGRSGGGLRGLLGPFAFLGAALGGAEMAPTFEAAAAGRAFFELPQIAAAWHPRLTDGGGACVAVTAEGTWLARPRSEHISCVDTLSARDSLGGMLPLLRPLLPLRRRSQPRGAELLRGMLLLGHLLRAAAPCHFSAAAVDALACRDCPPLQRALIECVLLRFDIWRRLATDVRSAHLSLLTALAASDEACILSSEALAALGAPPLLAHVLCSGSDAAGQQAALELLLQLAALHEAAALPTTAATELFLRAFSEPPFRPPCCPR
ncbi:hypothetical protein EMIHUDRAFT_456200 [Emiliania huxleyi CCMP1516]|uniref:DUF4704 domain-containing protein n=2 Tax=Emiliania huxleyi TaxID=2903 RepID=A0A0D3K7L1_EMIH1|nr:hypothetical protein EMIHUDRAFT_456200 [Emiliania huxleyi CCMP1516]EOD31746.1 hypothetical protein EMIHUDRAFT_456200 [Emiliania huxleyi CCMP1516]|eukprot:XP_005784175.1 hypothetical protein EMIHUDRAFT_456200 [Emiliania huxleyi CCMP1516]